MQLRFTRFPSSCLPFAPLLAAAALFAASAGQTRAATPLEFIVPDNDGYGIADCMKPGMECGRVMADAWCESHGHGHASVFGLSDDVVGSTMISSTEPATPAHSVIIRCGE